MNEDVACMAADLTKAAEEQVWQKLLLAILNGQTRYAHINALRQDRVSAEVVNVAKIVSEDSVRRAFLKGPEAAWDVLLDRCDWCWAWRSTGASNMPGATACRVCGPCLTAYRRSAGRG